MRLLETYANNCGVKLDPERPPTFPENFFPTPERYITVHASSGMDSKNYEHYDEVLFLMRDALQERSIAVVQIGEKDDPPVPATHHLMGLTNLRQSAYVVKNAMAHVGNDSLWTHYAGAVKTPCVALYGPTLANVCSPYHRGEFVAIESDRGGGRATHSVKEDPKTINYIKPERVANAALGLLGLPGVEGFESLYIGKYYKTPLIELVPDHLMPPLKEGLVNIRMDYHFDEDNMMSNAQLAKKVAIYTDRPIDRDKLKHISPKVDSVFYFLRPGEGVIDPKFAETLRDLAIEHGLIAFFDEGEDFDRLKLDFFDCKPLSRQDEPTRENVLRAIPDPGKVTPETRFKTNRLLVAGGSLYLSKAHWKSGRNISSNTDNERPIGELFDDADFWGQSEYYYLFNRQRRAAPLSAPALTI